MSVVVGQRLRFQVLFNIRLLLQLSSFLPTSTDNSIDFLMKDVNGMTCSVACTLLLASASCLAYRDGLLYIVVDLFYLSLMDTVHCYTGSYGISDCDALFLFFYKVLHLIQ